MTYDRAYLRASEIARKRRDWRYLILDCGEYHVASELDLDTYFQGCNQILVAFGPDGQPEAEP